MLTGICERLGQNNLDGLIVSSPSNISYLTDFLSRDSYFLVTNKANFYFTDSRYLQEAKNGLGRLAKIKKINGCFGELIADTLNALALRRVGFEERYLSFGEYKRIRQRLKKGIRLIPAYGAVEDLRKIKSAGEIAKIKKAIKITGSALKFIEPRLSAGKKEIEVAGELERFIRYNGSTGSAFEIIVACGGNSSFPHHRSGERKLKPAEPVLIDIGVDYQGYKSDLTRVFFLGRMTSTFRRIYDIVSAAKEKAVKTVKPGLAINRLDHTARQYIAQKGLGGFFTHGLGHGIGREVHEQPYISSKNTQRLAAGMVFTVEPAVYLPGKFGVRIEDIALVTEKGAEVLSGGFDKSD